VPQQVEKSSQPDGHGLSLTNCWSPGRSDPVAAASEELLADYEDMPIFADMDVPGSMELMDELPAPFYLDDCRGPPSPPGPEGQSFGFVGRCSDSTPPRQPQLPQSQQQQQRQQQHPQQHMYGAREDPPYNAHHLEVSRCGEQHSPLQQQPQQQQHRTWQPPQQQGRPPQRPMEDSWFYLDARRQEFGPMPTSAMRELFEGGYFPPGHALLVRQPHWANCVTVGDLWPEGGGPPFSEVLALPAPPAQPARPSGRRQLTDQPWMQMDMMPGQSPLPNDSMRFSGSCGPGGGSGPSRPNGKGGWQRGNDPQTGGNHGSRAELTSHANNNNLRCRPQGAAVDSWASSSEPFLAPVPSQDSSWDGWSGPGPGRPRNGPNGRKPKRWPQNQHQQQLQLPPPQQQQQHHWQHEQPCHQRHEQPCHHRQWQHVAGCGSSPQAQTTWPGNRSSSNHWNNSENMLPLDDIPTAVRHT